MGCRLQEGCSLLSLEGDPVWHQRSCASLRSQQLPRLSPITLGEAGSTRSVNVSNVGKHTRLTVRKRNIPGNQYVKNYEFDFAFGPPWGTCPVTMTSVIGHLTGLDFPMQYRKWHSCPPGQLFDVPVVETLDQVHRSAGLPLPHKH